MYYCLPLPPEGISEETAGVLYSVHHGGPFGTVPELLFEKNQLIPALQQLLISYVSPDCKNSFSR